MDLFLQLSYEKLKKETLVLQSLSSRGVLKDLPTYSSTRRRGYFIFIIGSAAFFLLKLVHPILNVRRCKKCKILQDFFTQKPKNIQNSRALCGMCSVY